MRMGTHPMGCEPPRPPAPRYPPAAPTRGLSPSGAWVDETITATVRRGDRRGPSWVAFVLFCLLFFFLGIIAGSAAARSHPEPSPSGGSSSAPASKSAAPAPSARLARTFGDGSWMAGPGGDVEPGTYRVRDAVTGGMCAWTIGDPGAKLPDGGDGVTGGRPVLQLPAGKQINSIGCGVWVKQ